jgi:hypothetical protein
MAANSANSIIGQSEVYINGSIIAHTRNVTITAEKKFATITNASTGVEVPSSFRDLGTMVTVEIELEEYKNADVFELFFGSAVGGKYIMGGTIGAKMTEHSLRIHPISLGTDRTADVNITKAVVTSAPELSMEAGDSQLIYTITLQGVYDSSIQGVGFIGSGN